MMRNPFSRTAAAIIDMIGSGICPLGVYWVCHAVVALAIFVIGTLLTWPALAAIAAIGFYGLREVRDVLSSKGDERAAEGLSRFDWPGLIAPTAAVMIAWTLVEMARLAG